MKKTYQKPTMAAQLFAANEYVAACYKIRCRTPARIYGKENGSWNYIYDDTNKNGELDEGDKELFHLEGGFHGCNKWHKGVILDTPPAANGFVSSNEVGKYKNKVAPVFYWTESLGSGYDYHVMTPGSESYESNPNAS